LIVTLVANNLKLALHIDQQVQTMKYENIVCYEVCILM